MASSDVRDVLNLPDAHGGPSRSAKKPKSAAPRQNLKGLAREVQNLNIGGDNPIALVPEVSTFRKRRVLAKKPAAHWELRRFRNSGRDDQSLVLSHWRRKTPKPPDADADTPRVDAPADDGKDDRDQASDAKDARDQTDPPPIQEFELEDSAFAKYNVKIPIPKYTDDQYRLLLEDADWSREETDYMMEVVENFELRWPLIWDRYEYLPSAVNGAPAADGTETKAVVPETKPRSMEDLKARYYDVAARLMAAQKPVQFMSQQEFDLHERMANFNARWEKDRKEFVARAMSRTREEAREEEMLLLELRRLAVRNETFNEERRELAQRLDYPHTDQDISSFKTSQGLQNLIQTMVHDKSRKRKSANGVGPGQDTASPSSGAPHPASAHESTGRRDSIATTARDSVAPYQTPTSAAGRKGTGGGLLAPPERRKLTPAEEAAYGVTRHDRLSAGPTFRTERINKLMLHKSNTQLQRTLNVLSELGQPSKLTMPTAAVTTAYEKLLGAIGNLLDARKVSDKLDAEIRLQHAKRAVRDSGLEESLEAGLKEDPGGPTPSEADEPSMAEAKKSARTQDEQPEARPKSAGAEPAASGGATTPTGVGARGEGADETSEPKVKFRSDTEEQQQQQQAVNADGESAGQHDAADGGKPGRKRSASVMSAVSGDDKTAKRLKQ